MPVSESFRAFVLEQLDRVTRDLHDRRMFGGVGIYAGELFFALIANDILYFKVDDETRAGFEAEGMKPFRPYGNQRQTLQYYELPLRILEDTDALRGWAAAAIDAARRAPGNHMKKR